MKGKRVLAILTSLVLTVGTLSVGAYAADGGSAPATTGKTAQAAAEDPCADGHDYVVKETVEPTCEKEGYTVYVCTRCEDTKTEKVDALGHDYQATETVEPTCEEDGYTVYTCSRCGDSYTDDETEALDHKYEVTKTVEPTCTKKGSVTYTCSNCGDSYEEETDALGHDFSGAPKTTKEATVEAEGELTYYCTHDGCKETLVEKIDKLKAEDKKDASKLITEEGETEIVKEEAKKAGEETSVFKVYGQAVESESGDIAGTDGKASFKKEGDGYTLTLKGATLTYDASSASEGTQAAAVIEYTGSDPLKISVKGENTITYSGASASTGFGIIAANADVTIEGTKEDDDTLIITTQNGNALYAKSIEIEDPLGIVSPEKGEIGDVTVSENKYKGILNEGATAPDVTIKTVTYTVKYDGNGGSGKMDDGSVLKGEVYTLEKCGFTAPEGQEFEAWTVNGKDYEEEEDVSVTDNTIVTAKWKTKVVSTYTVTYEAGDYGTGNTYTDTAEDNKPYTLLNNRFEPKSGYEFKKWKIGTTHYAPGDQYDVTEDVTVTAVWKKKAVAPQTYTVTYEPGENGTGEAYTETAKEDESYTLLNSRFEPKSGYEFKKWKIGTTHYAPGDQYDVTEDVTVTAVWKKKAVAPQTYTVTYEPGENGTGEAYTETAKEDESYTLLNNKFEPKSGYEFKKWKIGATEYAPGEQFDVTSDVTVVAIWKEVKTPSDSDIKEYTISFVPGEGASGEIFSLVIKDNKVKLPECTFTAPPGKVFAGWKIGNKAEPFEANHTITFPNGVRANVTATAQWKTDNGESEEETESGTYTVTYVKGEGSGTMNTTTVEKGQKLTLPKCEFGAPDDKCFDKWQIGEKTYAVGESVSITEDTTVTALWKDHEWDEVEYTWSTDNATCSAKSKCKDCGHEATEQATVTKTTTATCEADGTATYTAKFTKNTSWNTEKKVEEKALGHDWQEPKIEWTDSTHAKATMTCSRDSSHTKTEDAKVTGSATLPTTTENGTVKYTATVTIDGKEYTDTREEAVEPAGSNKGYKFTVKPESWTKRTTTTSTTNTNSVSTNSTNTLRFTIKRDKFDVLTYSAFTSGGSVQIDGKTVENKNNSSYTTAKGSLILTFMPSYLNTLTAGSHTLKVNFKDGSVDTKFTVKGTTAATGTNRTTNATTNRTTSSPRTGDYSNWALWIGLVAVSVIGIGAIVYFKKRGKKSE